MQTQVFKSPIDVCERKKSKTKRGEKIWIATLFKAECKVADKYAKISTMIITHPPSACFSNHATPSSRCWKIAFAVYPPFFCPIDNWLILSGSAFCLQIFYPARSFDLQSRHFKGLKYNIDSPVNVPNCSRSFWTFIASFRNEFCLRIRRSKK